MKKEKKGLIVLMAIAGLLLVGNVIGYLQPIFAGEDQTVQTTDGTNNLNSSIDEIVNSKETGETTTNVNGNKAKEDADSTHKVEESSSDDSAIKPLKIGVQDNQNVAEVTTWAEFMNAFGTATVDVISIQNDIAIPEGSGGVTDGVTVDLRRNDTLSNGLNQYSGLYESNTARPLIIEGNNHKFDFGSICITLHPATVPSGATRGWDLTWRNLEVYHGNYYGFFTLRDLNDAENISSATYENITNYGNQVIHSENALVTLKGSFKTIQQEYFNSGLRSESGWRSSGTNQVNFRVTDMVIEDEAVIEMETLEAGNVYLQSGGSLKIGKNANVKIKAGQNDSTGEGDGDATNLRISGNVEVGENATVELIPKPNYSAIQLTGSGAAIDIGNSAAVNITSTGHTNNYSGSNRSIVSLAGGSKLTVNEEGTLNINATGMGSSNSDIIYVSGAAEFTVQRKGTFDVKSDSTSNSQRLINIRNSNSVFRFADAQRVNLQRTSLISGTSNGLIEIAGSSGYLDVDIQKVNRWEQGNLTDTPTKVWTPMYGMNIVYNSQTSTVQNASSLTEETVNTFKNEFKTNNTQRVLFEYIPDVNVSINSIATDNVDDDSSYVIRGNTNPGAYVRIWDEPINDTVTPAMDASDNNVESPAEMASPVEGDPDFTSNFTLQADETTGDFEYTIPNGKKLIAEGKVKVFAFLEGKYDEAEQIILDATPPTADPKSYIISVGDSAPNSSALVKNVQDTNPLKQTFTYSYADPDGVNALLNTPSEEGHNVEIVVKDNAGNSTTVTSKLIIWDLGQELKGEDFSIKSNDVSGKSEEELKQIIRDNGNLTAFTLFEGEQVDLSDRIEITDLDGISPTPGDYTVTLNVPADTSIGLTSPLTGTLIVTVSDDVPPTGTGKSTLVPLGKPEYITEGELKDFLAEFSDNVSEPENITASLVNPDTIEELVETTGEKIIQLTLKDEAGNISEPIDIPIIVFDGEVSGNVAITGEDFRLDRSEWENAVTENQLKEFILANGQVEAVELIEGVVTSVTDTDKVSIDVEEVIVDSAHEEQPMTITLTVDNGTDKVSKTIQVTFNDKTAPTAEPKPTEINIGNVNAIQNADPKIFLENLTDNVSEVDKISVEFAENQDFDEMVQTPGPKELLIELVDEAGNKAIITVEITIFDNSLTIRFVDSKDQDIVTPVVISDKIPGDKVDLTAEQAVLKGLQEAEDLHYLLLTRPEDEDQVEVTSTGKIVKYEFDGTLFISSYPKTLDFETHQVWFSDIRVEKPQYQEPLVIWDNRGIKANWTLTATLTKDFTLQAGDVDDPNFVLTDVLSYQKTTEENSAVVLHDEAEAVYSAQHAEDQSEYNISDTWDENGPGLKFETTAANVKKLGDYQAEILWTLGDAR